MRLRVAGVATDVTVSGTVWDFCDFLTGLARTNLRAFLPGPWGRGDPALAAEMLRRCSTPPCAQQCFVVAHLDGERTLSGCSCSSGWQYTDDNDVAKLEGCSPNDLWSDARALVTKHHEVGRGIGDPILCDCDDLTAICSACSVYARWMANGRRMRNGRPLDPEGQTLLAITRPQGSNMAHAWIGSDAPPMEGEPAVKVRGLHVFDPAARWGMKRPPDRFYERGEVALYPLRLSDL